MSHSPSDAVCEPSPTAETSTGTLLPRCSLILGVSTIYCFTRLSTRRWWNDARLKLSDDLHPTAGGIEAVVTRILPKVEALIHHARRKDDRTFTTRLSWDAAILVAGGEVLAIQSSAR
jgi:hypothetical protein